MCVRIAVDFEYSSNSHIKVCLYVSVCMQECCSVVAWVIHYSLPWSDAYTHTHTHTHTEPAQQKGSLLQSWPPAGIEKVSLSPSLSLYSCRDSHQRRFPLLFFICHLYLSVVARLMSVLCTDKCSLLFITSRHAPYCWLDTSLFWYSASTQFSKAFLTVII